MTTLSRAVLVTGCSTGIGRETATLFARQGWTVYASARRLESIADLENEGCRLLALDVTDAASCAAAVDAVVAEERAVGVLVNNAGIMELDAFETVSIERVRAMFETNVFGLIRLTQLVLPGMREQRWGRIINVGSMNGKFPFPGMSAYGATKHGIEALSDALRYEIGPFGVDVSIIEPGMVTTPLAQGAASRRDTSAGGVYGAYNAAVAESALSVGQGPFARFACTPQDVARVILKAAADPRRPRTRYRVAPSAHLLLTARALLPDRAFDALLRRFVPVPEAPSSRPVPEAPSGR
ncbi:SDR family NAD(P)-dependent oxidoreductase [Microbacterium sp. BK668]|uniref:SDR family NAD(P)-dependent oxidoreductase n=1 Tax=Microbacterium sp. BK668 TaxID=2512118 RepID=UPI00106233AB|nr:SDR family NAD(P)-dependent oxidoreductase [Microbacterium sp. BK668]TDN88595.1 NADP-dependent 3-hydroxy acid dehydrogenase YdfG [Microbacterium sp. BK668]